MTPTQDMQVLDLCKKLAGDNALEYITGLLSSIVTEVEGDFLIHGLTQRYMEAYGV